MKHNLAISRHPADRLELAQCTAAGVLLRDRHGTEFIPFGRQPRNRAPEPRTPRDETEFAEGRRGRALTRTVLPADFVLG